MKPNHRLFPLVSHTTNSLQTDNQIINSIFQDFSGVDPFVFFTFQSEFCWWYWQPGMECATSPSSRQSVPDPLGTKHNINVMISRKLSSCQIFLSPNKYDTKDTNLTVTSLCQCQHNLYKLVWRNENVSSDYYGDLCVCLMKQTKVWWL